MKNDNSSGPLWLAFLFGLVIGLVLITGFIPEFPYTAYVAPCKGQYCVYIGAIGTDPLLSKPQSLEQATKMAAEINNIMDGKWDGKPH